MTMSTPSGPGMTARLGSSQGEISSSTGRSQMPSARLVPMSAEPSLVPELAVIDCSVSVRFWRDLLGFEVLYDRPEEGFAYLALDGME